MYEQFMGDYTYRDSASRQVQFFISFVNFRATSLVSISYIFPPTVVLIACSKRSDSGERCEVKIAIKSRGGLGRNRLWY